MGKFQSSKVFDGFSTVFRQHNAKTTHCSFLHGYGISFKVYFEGELDDRNWVWDFGGMKRAKGQIDGLSPKDWMEYMFDHTFLVAEDDPFVESFLKMNEVGAAQVRVIPAITPPTFTKIATVSATCSSYSNCRPTESTSFRLNTSIDFKNRENFIIICNST